MRYDCCSDNRRALVAAHPTLNGIDFLEVVDDPAMPDAERQRTLVVRFVKPLAAALPVEQVRVDGGERIRGVRVTEVRATGDPAVVEVRVDRRADFSTYTLRLVGDPDDPSSTEPPPGFDPLLSAVDFTFKAECPSPYDCEAPPPAKRPDAPAPQPDYLARDYASLRSLLFDRMSTLLPDWQERHPADVRTALVELVAYVGDRLSYAQDSVATEAYLGTARHRVSVRRHARLVDYRMHDGCNARTWVQVRAAADVVPPDAAAWNAVERGTVFLTSVPGLPPVVAVGSPLLRDALVGGPTVFEAAHPLRALRVAHNDVPFYTWTGERCRLRAGATAATLARSLPGLAVGDVLVLAEVPDASSGDTAAASRARRHPVRLTAVRALAGGAALTDPLTGDEITEVEWDEADALPFDLAVAGEDGVSTAVAHGNVVLADSGMTVGAVLPAAPERLGPVPSPRMAWAPGTAGEGYDPCEETEPVAVPPRFRPVLALGPVTQAGPVDLAAPAAAAYRQDPREALPAVRLADDSGVDWSPRHDLLGSDGSAPDFVVEVDDEGRAIVRFGDGTYGAAPAEGAVLTARYRVGNGAAANVGPETLVHAIVPADRVASVERVVNPLAAAGGTDPETIAEVRRSAPEAMRTQRRAVTPEDYETFARAFPGVQQAVATFRWTGSWHTVFVTVDRSGGRPVDDEFAAALRAYLEPFRMAGHDLEVDPPVYVPLEVAVRVCAAPGHHPAHVRAAVAEVLAREFHPDRFTMRQTVWLSPLYAAVQAVPGVDTVRVTKFRRWGTKDTSARAAGRLTLGRLEVARLDNDPNFPDRGVLDLVVEGGS